MYIDEIVLDKFKSFGRKTRLPFYEDFTTVSGPNGSGKSNIIDAVLFALGLARTRGIRAEKLTDLIYNPGHEGEEAGEGPPRPNEANVTVVLNNEDRTVTRSQVVNAAGSDDVGDVDTVRIRRRVKRTGENYYSYYYLNGRSVNLSDIRDLLAQAGVTPEGYNVVMQGDVTEIITMTPGSRREIIDEIAGVAEFDQKKASAFEELDTVESRIEEADLRIEEKRDRLDQLEDEREAALEYQDLREEKAQQESHLTAAELEAKRDSYREIRTEIDTVEADLEGLRATLDEKQGRVVRLESDLEDLSKEIERKGEDEQLRLEREVERIKGEIARIEDKVEAAEDRIEDAENRRREAFVEIDRKNETVDDLEAGIKEIKVEKASLAADVQEREAEIESIEAEIDAADTEFDELKDDLAERKDALEAAKTEKNDLQREKDRLLDEARRRSTDIEQAEADLTEAKQQLPELDAELADLRDEREKAERNVDSIESVVDDLKAEKRALKEDVANVEDRLQERQREYAELEANAGENGDSSFGRSVSTVLNAGIEGVHGAVAQLGSVAGEYASACETAAGGRMANVVVDDDVVGQRCIDHLKSRNAGRATFLPMTEMHSRRLPSLPEHPGVVDFAYELVDFEPAYAEVFSYVLGDTLVVEDMDTAREFMGDFRMVTLDGDLVEKSGAMTGGSGSGSRYSFSKSGKGQIERVAEAIQDLEDERASLREDIEDVEERLDSARDRKSDATDRVRSIETQIERVEGKRADAEDRIADLEDDLGSMREERASVDERMSDLDERIAEQAAAIESIEAEVADLEAELEDSKIPELTDRKEELRGEIADLEDRMADLDADLNEKQLEKGYAEDAIDDLHDDIEAAQNDKADAEDEVADLEARTAEKRETLEEKRAAIEDLEDELADLKAEREDLRGELRAAKDERDEAKAAVNDREEDLGEAREEAERLEWEIDELESEVGDYDPDDIPDHDTVEKRIAELEAEMAALEPVNMLAIDEYDEVQAALDDLEDKRATLAEERDGIEERIDRYEQQKKATFMESYEAIDEQFTEVFERLSGGTARLHLEDEEDPFEGGLTMKAQPGDKPIQRLDAMSGGEKSLTALAFIFAIQRHNPAPFYALDEVDAFLDAANADRVGEMVDELSDDAQFVVVSHRGAMLDRSDRAIGVTMQDDNVSAVTGIDLGGGIPADD